MAWTTSVLVVSNLTATSDALVDAMSARAKDGLARFTLVVPAARPGPGNPVAEERLAHALERMRAAGLDVDGSVADHDPIVAVKDAWDPASYDEIIVSTLPSATSNWVRADLPQRIRRMTDAHVTHVIAKPEDPGVQAEHVEHERSTLGPLSVLSWSKPADDDRPVHG